MQQIGIQQDLHLWRYPRPSRPSRQNDLLNKHIVHHGSIGCCEKRLVCKRSYNLESLIPLQFSKTQHAANRDKAAEAFWANEFRLGNEVVGLSILYILCILLSSYHLVHR
jgi:hypothetical protein